MRRKPCSCRSSAARAAGTKVEPDPVETARQYGAETAVLDWCERLACSRFGPAGRYGVEQDGAAIGSHFPSKRLVSHLSLAFASVRPGSASHLCCNGFVPTFGL